MNCYNNNTTVHVLLYHYIIEGALLFCWLLSRYHLKHGIRKCREVVQVVRHQNEIVGIRRPYVSSYCGLFFGLPLNRRPTGNVDSLIALLLPSLLPKMRVEEKSEMTGENLRIVPHKSFQSIPHIRNTLNMQTTLKKQATASLGSRQASCTMSCTHNGPDAFKSDSTRGQWMRTWTTILSKQSKKKV